jgi:hypothetical protein
MSSRMSQRFIVVKVRLDHLLAGESLFEDFSDLPPVKRTHPANRLRCFILIGYDKTSDAIID